MFIAPASNASVPFAIVIRTLSSCAERDLSPPDTDTAVADVLTLPEDTHVNAAAFSRDKVIIPLTVLAESVAPQTINPAVLAAATEAPAFITAAAVEM